MNYDIWLEHMEQSDRGWDKEPDYACEYCGDAVNKEGEICKNCIV